MNIESEKKTILAAKRKSLAQANKWNKFKQVTGDLANRGKRTLLKRENSAGPIQLHFKEPYGVFYLHVGASEPEIKAVKLCWRNFQTSNKVVFKIVVTFYLSLWGHHSWNLFVVGSTFWKKTSMGRVPYNKLLTSLTWSSRSGKYMGRQFVLDRYCYDLRPVFLSSAVKLG